MKENRNRILELLLGKGIGRGTISIGIAALFAVMVATTGLAVAAQVPAGCSSTALGISLTESLTTVHDGEGITYAVTVSLPQSTDCGVDLNLTFRYPNGSQVLVNGVTLNMTPGDPRSKSFVLGPYVVLHADEIGAGKKVTATAGASGTAYHIFEEPIEASTSISASVIHPVITVEKGCTPVSQTAPGTITWRIVANNTGDTPLSVTLSDTMHGNVNLGTLVPGESNVTTFTSGDLPTGSYTDIVTATGVDMTGRQVTNASSATCSVTEEKGEHKVVGWGLIGSKRNPDLEFHLFDYNRFTKQPVYVKDNRKGIVIEASQATVRTTLTPNKKGWISGSATVNGVGSYPFEIYVEDNADPSDGKDVFKISLPTYGPTGYFFDGKPIMGDINVVK